MTDTAEITINRRDSKLLEKILEGCESVGRPEATRLLQSLGFSLRTTGSHQIWTHPNVKDHINWKYRKRTEAVWGYQINQLRNAISDLLQNAKVENGIEKEEKEVPAKLDERYALRGSEVQEYHDKTKEFEARMNTTKLNIDGLDTLNGQRPNSNGSINELLTTVHTK